MRARMQARVQATPHELAHASRHAGAHTQAWCTLCAMGASFESSWRCLWPRGIMPSRLAKQALNLTTVQIKMHRLGLHAATITSQQQLPHAPHLLHQRLRHLGRSVAAAVRCQGATRLADLKQPLVGEAGQRLLEACKHGAWAHGHMAGMPTHQGACTCNASRHCELGAARSVDLGTALQAGSCCSLQIYIWVHVCMQWWRIVSRGPCSPPAALWAKAA